jgi:hypothetical protein
MPAAGGQAHARDTHAECARDQTLRLLVRRAIGRRRRKAQPQPAVPDARYLQASGARLRADPQAQDFTVPIAAGDRRADHGSEQLHPDQPAAVHAAHELRPGQQTNQHLNGENREQR